MLEHTFHLAPEVKHQNRKVYSITQLLAHIGGLGLVISKGLAHVMDPYDQFTFDL